MPALPCRLALLRGVRTLSSPNNAAEAYRFARAAPSSARQPLTTAVGVVVVPRRVVPAQPLQQQAVVHQPLDGLQQERVERQVADFLELELLVHGLQLPGALGGLLQFGQHLVVPVEVAGELLWRHRRGWLGQGPGEGAPLGVACLGGSPGWMSHSGWEPQWAEQRTTARACQLGFQPPWGSSTSTQPLASRRAAACPGRIHPLAADCPQTSGGGGPQMKPAAEVTAGSSRPGRAASATLQSGQSLLNPLTREGRSLLTRSQHKRTHVRAGSVSVIFNSTSPSLLEASDIQTVGFNEHYM